MKKIILSLLLSAAVMTGCAAVQNNTYPDDTEYPPPEIVSEEITGSSAVSATEITGTDLSQEETESFSEENISGEIETDVYEETETVLSSEETFPADNETVTEAPSTESNGSELKFRSKKLLDQHYEKHGREMGFESPEEYEAAAAAVVADHDVLHKTEAEDGDDVYYIEATNEFVIVSTDGFIRTYFYPSAGKKYFDRQ